MEKQIFRFISTFLAYFIYFSNLNSQINENFLNKEDCSVNEIDFLTDPDFKNIINYITHDVIGIKIKLDLYVCNSINFPIAGIKEGRAYILLNPNEFISLKSLNIKKLRIPNESDNWVKLFVLCHEIAHILNDHFNNFESTPLEKELEADETAGFIMFRLGSSLSNTQRIINFFPCYEANHKERLKAISDGWERAENFFLDNLARQEPD